VGFSPSTAPPREINERDSKFWENVVRIIILSAGESSIQNLNRVKTSQLLFLLRWYMAAGAKFASRVVMPLGFPVPRAHR
jgi:hypothetical protein